MDSLPPNVQAFYRELIRAYGYERDLVPDTIINPQQAVTGAILLQPFFLTLFPPQDVHDITTSEIERLFEGATMGNAHLSRPRVHTAPGRIVPDDNQLSQAQLFDKLEQALAWLREYYIPLVHTAARVIKSDLVRLSFAGQFVSEDFLNVLTTITHNRATANRDNGIRWYVWQCFRAAPGSGEGRMTIERTSNDLRHLYWGVDAPWGHFAIDTTAVEAEIRQEIRQATS